MAVRIQDITLEDIYEFRDHGNWNKAPSEVVETLDVLDKVRGLYLRGKEYGTRDGIINHLTKIEGYNYYMACKYHDMAMEYFYCDREISKNAHRFRIAEKLEKLAELGMAVAKDVNDIGKVAKIFTDVVKTLGLDQPDQEAFPEELLGKPFKMYSLDTEFLGLPSIDRYELKRLIDELPQLTEKERMMAKREALVLPPKLFLDASEDPRSSQ